MANPAPGFRSRPDHAVGVARHEGRHRVVFAGETLADSRDTLLVTETHHGAQHYFPAADVRVDLLRPSGTRTHCPFKGDACYWHVVVGGDTVEDAVWAYPDPFDEVRELASHVAFDMARLGTMRYGD